MKSSVCPAGWKATSSSSNQSSCDERSAGVCRRLPAACGPVRARWCGRCAVAWPLDGRREAGIEGVTPRQRGLGGLTERYDAPPTAPKPVHDRVSVRQPDTGPTNARQPPLRVAGAAVPVGSISARAAGRSAPPRSPACRPCTPVRSVTNGPSRPRGPCQPDRYQPHAKRSVPYSLCLTQW